MLSLNVMVGRLILAVLVVGPLLLVAMDLSERDALDFVTTVVAFTVSTYVNRAALGARLGDAEESTDNRFAGVLSTLAEHPIYRWIVTSHAYWIATGVGIGVAVALTENWLLKRWFGPDEFAYPGPSVVEYTVAQQTLVLFLILAVVYGAWSYVEERGRYAASEWRTRLRRELYGIVGADPETASRTTRIVVRAVSRSSLVTASRSAALLVLPAITDSTLLLTALALAVLAVIAGGPELAALLKRATATASWAAPRGVDSESPPLERANRDKSSEPDATPQPDARPARSDFDSGW